MSQMHSERLSQRKGERGSILAMSAVGMTAFLLAVGLCVDVSHFYVVKAELQNAADASALAGASALNSSAGGITNAADRAVEEMNRSGFNNTDVSIPRQNVRFAVNLGDFDSGNDLSETQAKAAPKTVRFVRVRTAKTPTNVTFVRFVLGDSKDLSAEAVAGMSAPINNLCSDSWLPLSVVDDDIATITPGNLYVIRAGPHNSVSPGNYQELSFAGKGGSTLRESLASGIDVCLTTGELVETKPGITAGPVRQGLNTRFDDYQGSGLNPTDHPPDTNIAENITYEQYLNGSPKQAPSNPGVAGRRIVFIPIIKISQYNGGRDEVEIDRFGVFFLRKRVSGGNGGDIEAEFIGTTLTVGGGGFDPEGGTPTSVLAIPVLYR